MGCLTVVMMRVLVSRDATYVFRAIFNRAF